MQTLLTFLPMLVVLSIGLLVTVSIIKNDRKQTLEEADELKYANFGLRFLAFIIDFLILSAIDYILLIKLLNVDVSTTLKDLGFISIYSHPAAIVTGWIYYSAFESSRLMATPGKLVINLKVTNLNQNKLTFLNATGRYFGKILSSIILCLGFLMMLFMKKRQCLHDYLANTIVIKNGLI